MVYYIIKGILIGVLVSAPLGPSGVLCIQRTLSKGRLYGLVTGLGVAISDLLYAMITGFGISFVTPFIENNEFLLQITGSLVMFGFGLYLFWNNPLKTLSNSTEEKGSYVQQFVTGFLLTFSNVFIIFLFIGLYARFSYIQGDATIFMHMLSILLIFTGAILWWFVVTYLISKVKERYNIRNLFFVNKITGTIILIISIVGILNAFGLIHAFDGDSFITQLLAHTPY